jgi:hypothetical protein
MWVWEVVVAVVVIVVMIIRARVVSLSLAYVSMWNAPLVGPSLSLRTLTGHLIYTHVNALHNKDWNGKTFDRYRLSRQTGARRNLELGTDPYRHIH